MHSSLLFIWFVSFARTFTYFYFPLSSLLTSSNASTKFFF